MTSKYFEIDMTALTFDNTNSDDSDWYDTMNQKYERKQTVLQHKEMRRLKYEQPVDAF